MSTFIKKASLILGSLAILYIFTCTTFLPFYHSNKTINHDEVVVYVLEEVTYEMNYGDKDIDIEAFVDKAISEAISNN